MKFQVSVFIFHSLVEGKKEGRKKGREWGQREGRKGKKEKGKEGEEHISTIFHHQLYI